MAVRTAETMSCNAPDAEFVLLTESSTRPVKLSIAVTTSPITVCVEEM